MTTVYFYFNFPTVPTDISDTTKYKQNAVVSSTHPCSSDIEYDCVKKNLFSNWAVGSASCSLVERCLSGTRCCSASCPITGCNKTCKQVEQTGINCKGFNPGTCDCTGNWGSHSVARACSYICYSPPSDTYCYPGATKVEYVEGRKDVSNDIDYTFKATYNITTFTTPAQIKQLEDTLNEKSVRLKTDYKVSNTAQLNILKKRVCISSNLFTEPCTTYCEPNLTGQLPISNCTDAWNTFCKYGDNIASEPCKIWCAVNSSSNSNCKDTYLEYCNNPANFAKSVCKEFYKTQYINNQLSDSVATLLKTQCAKYADENGNVLDSDGKIVEPGASTTKYPVSTCACFLPDKVYSTFYDTSTEDYPELRKFFTINQCSYPDCANTVALQPQKMTCPDVAVTSCIVNNTIGGNVTNSNFNIVNACITQVEETGTYTRTNANVAPEEEEEAETVKAVIPPPEVDLGKDVASATTGPDGPSEEPPLGKSTYQGVAAGIGFVMVVLTLASYSEWKKEDAEASPFFKFVVPVIVLILGVFLGLAIQMIQ